jgi:X-Pro dipeptidyl-peptidase
MPRPLSGAIAAFLLLLLPQTASAADVFETLKVRTIDGETVHVEIARPDDAGKVPVILTYSPYNTLGETTTPNLANDGLYEDFGKKGYARAVADVLGTRNSTGCWDYGGAKEQQSGVDLVNALARQPWSNGKVAMIGGSYDGTTANMVAARGADAPGLAAIVPQAAISRWYGYAYQDGVRYFLNSEVPSDEGFDTPLAFDFGLARTPPTHPDAAPGALPGRLSPCESPEHTEYGYSRAPDYDDFWLQRDYRKDAGAFRVPALVTHGWQDYNVKQSEGVDLFKALRRSDRSWEKLFVFQGPHATPEHEQYTSLVERFFARTLKGARNGIEDEPAVWTEGRTAEETTPLRTETAWPPRGTRTRSIALTREDGAAEASFTDMSTSSEELAREDPEAEGSWLFYATGELDQDTRLAGTPVLDALVKVDGDHGQLAPTLVDIAPDGSTTAISRGFLNLKYRGGLAKGEPVPADQPVRARVRFAPQDHTVAKGHRIGVIVAGSNVVWALPDDPGVTTTVVSGSSRLELPVVGPVDPEAAPGPAAIGPAVGGGASRRAARRVTLRVRRVGKRVIATGTAPRGARLSLRLTRKGARAATKRITARRGTFRATFKRVPRRRAIRVTATLRGTKIRATRRLAAARR